MQHVNYDAVLDFVVDENQAALESMQHEKYDAVLYFVAAENQAVAGASVDVVDQAYDYLFLSSNRHPIQTPLSLA